MANKLLFRFPTILLAAALLTACEQPRRTNEPGGGRVQSGETASDRAQMRRDTTTGTSATDTSRSGTSGTTGTTTTGTGTSGIGSTTRSGEVSESNRMGDTSVNTGQTTTGRAGDASSGRAGAVASPSGVATPRS